MSLVGLPLTLKFDNTNSLLDPTQGIRASFSATPTGALGSNNSGFLILEAAGSTYLDLSGNGRSVLALRGLVGEVPGTNTFSLPPDQRFYAGGSATVRGFKYQSVGPQFPDRNPTGGTAVSAATVEFRQRIIGNYGAVAFVDAGQVSANGVPFSNTWRIGAGVGIPLLHLDRPDPAGRGGAGGPPARGRCVRIVHRDRASILTVNARSVATEQSPGRSNLAVSTHAACDCVTDLDCITAPASNIPRFRHGRV